MVRASTTILTPKGAKMNNTKYKINDWVFYIHHTQGQRDYAVVKGKIHTIHYYGEDETPRYSVTDKNDYSFDTLDEDEIYIDEDEAIKTMWFQEVERSTYYLKNDKKKLKETKDRLEYAKSSLKECDDN